MTVKHKTRTFPKALLHEWGLPWDGAVEDEIEETSRWSEHHRIVFKAPDDGLFYETGYAKGLTEYQDETPWEYETEIVGTEVVKRKVLIYKYIPVEVS